MKITNLRGDLTNSLAKTEALVHIASMPLGSDESLVDECHVSIHCAWILYRKYESTYHQESSLIILDGTPMQWCSRCILQMCQFKTCAWKTRPLNLTLVTYCICRSKIHWMHLVWFVITMPELLLALKRWNHTVVLHPGYRRQQDEVILVLEYTT